MSISSLPMMTSADPMGTALLRDRLAEREQYTGVPVMAHVFVRDAHLSMESRTGALMPRPVLYMHGTITSVDSDSFPEQVQRGVFVDEGSLSRGCDTFVRYEFSDLQVMRLMLRGAGRADWSGLDPQMVSNDHVLPFTADVTVIHKPNAQLPFIVCDICDPMSVVVTRDTCGYDYVDYGGASPSAVNELGAEQVRQLDAMLKQMDAPVRPSTERENEGDMSYYEDRLFESVFSAEDRAREADEDLQRGRARERHLTREQQAQQDASEVKRIEQAPVVDQTTPGGIGSSVVSELVAERERARDARTARLATEERAQREAEAKAADAQLSSLLDGLFDDVDEDTEKKKDSARSRTTAQRQVQAATIDAVAHDEPIESALSAFDDVDDEAPQKKADDFEFGM